MDAFDYYENTYVIGRDGEVYFLADLWAVHNLPGKIDDDGVIVPRQP